MKAEYKKGDLIGWRLKVDVNQMIKELELEEIVRVSDKAFGYLDVLRQQATKDFTIEITIKE